MPTFKKVVLTAKVIFFFFFYLGADGIYIACEYCRVDLQSGFTSGSAFIQECLQTSCISDAGSN